LKKTFVINGPGRSGKDTFIKIVRLFLRNSGFQVWSFSSIFPVKLKLIESGIWDGISEKTTQARKSMAELKKEMTENGDIPNSYLIESIQNLTDHTITFVHIREAENIRQFLEKHKSQLGYDARTIHYMRDDGTLEEFHSGVDLIDETRKFENYDFDIINSVHGLDKMKPLVSDFLKEIGLECSVFDIKLLDDEKLHKEFNDEQKAGIL
jgi:hypothetical protein